MIKYCKVSKCRYPVAHTTIYHQCGTCSKFGHGMIECNDQSKINYLKQFYNNELPIELNCLFGGCLKASTHITDSHTCELCNKRFHSTSTCPSSNIKESHIECPICRKINKSFIRSFGSTNKCVVCFDNVQIFLPECGHDCLCISCCNKINKNNKSGEIYDENYLLEHHYDVPLIKTKFKEYPSYVVIYEGMGCCTLVRRLNINSNIEGLFIHSDDGYDPIKVKINDEFINGYCRIDSQIVHDR